MSGEGSARVGGDRRFRTSLPFEVPPDAGRSVGSRLTGTAVEASPAPPSAHNSNRSTVRYSGPSAVSVLSVSRSSSTARRPTLGSRSRTARWTAVLPAAWSIRASVAYGVGNLGIKSTSRTTPFLFWSSGDSGSSFRSVHLVVRTVQCDIQIECIYAFVVLECGAGNIPPVALVVRLHRFFTSRQAQNNCEGSWKGRRQVASENLWLSSPGFPSNYGLDVYTHSGGKGYRGYCDFLAFRLRYPVESPK